MLQLPVSCHPTSCPPKYDRCIFHGPLRAHDGDFIFPYSKVQILNLTDKNCPHRHRWKQRGSRKRK